MQTLVVLILRWILWLVIWVVVSGLIQWLFLSTQRGDILQNFVIVLLAWTVGPALGAYLSGVCVSSWARSANHQLIHHWFVWVPIALSGLALVATVWLHWNGLTDRTPASQIVILGAQVAGFYFGAWFSRPEKDGVSEPE